MNTCITLELHQSRRTAQWASIRRVLSVFIQLFALLMLVWAFLRLDGARMFETSDGCASRIAWAVGECAVSSDSTPLNDES